MKSTIRACLLLLLLAVPALANSPAPRPLPLESFALYFANLDSFPDHVFYLKSDEPRLLEVGKAVPLSKAKKQDRLDRTPIAWQLFAVAKEAHDEAEVTPDPAWFEPGAPGVLAAPVVNEEVPRGVWRSEAKAKRTYQVAITGDQLTVIAAGDAEVEGRAQYGGGGGLGAAVEAGVRWVMWIGIAFGIVALLVVAVVVFFLVRSARSRPAGD